MSLETVRIDVDETGYTLAGQNVTSLTLEERLTASMRAVFVPTGDAAPLVGEADYIRFDSQLVVNTGVPADIYILSPSGPANIGVARG